MRYCLLIALALVLAACQPRQDGGALVDNDLVIETAVSITATTPLPTATLTQSNLTPTPLQPEAIPQTSTSEPTPTATQTPASFSPPGWITEPSANILVLAAVPTRTISIFDVDGRQRYDIPVRMNELGPHWRWREDSFWLSYQESTGVTKIIDVVTGEVFRESDTGGDNVSPDGRYIAHIVTEGDRKGLATIIDRETSATSELVNPFLHRQSRDEPFIESAWAVYWSPDGVYLSVLYDKLYDSDNYDRNLAIYTATGEIVYQYADLDTSWTNPWSPVMPYRILYADRSTPCILEVIAEKRECLEIVRQWLAEQDVTPFHFMWSPDGDNISFVYGNTDALKTGVCYVKLSEGDIVCPISTADLWLGEQLFARIQFWSPDGKYLVLFADNIGFMDVIGPMKVTVIDIEGQNFWHLEGEYSWPFSNPWRPSIDFETAE